MGNRPKIERDGAADPRPKVGRGGAAVPCPKVGRSIDSRPKVGRSGNSRPKVERSGAADHARRSGEASTLVRRSGEAATHARRSSEAGRPTLVSLPPCDLGASTPVHGVPSLYVWIPRRCYIWSAGTNPENAFCFRYID